MMGADQKSVILGNLEAVASDGPDALVNFARHVGLNLRALRDPRDLSAAWLGHYRVRLGTYDVERAALDLVTWPPVALRIKELRNAPPS